MQWPKNKISGRDGDRGLSAAPAKALCNFTSPKYWSVIWAGSVGLLPKETRSGNTGPVVISRAISLSWILHNRIHNQVFIDNIKNTHHLCGNISEGDIMPQAGTLVGTMAYPVPKRLLRNVSSIYQY